MTREQARQILDAARVYRDAARDCQAQLDGPRSEFRAALDAEQQAHDALVRLVLDQVDPAEWGRAS